jgi:SP family arabinose:H+ symporter-like MFS transporter
LPAKADNRGAMGTVLIVALSGFLMGFDGSLFTGAVGMVKKHFDLSTFEVGWTNASQVVSATLAIFLAGPLADRVGRRTILRAAALLFAIGALLSALAQGMVELIAGRLIGGLGIGAVLVAGPMYIAEIAPPALRGRMVTYQQLFIVIGIALAFVSNYLVVHLEKFDFAWIATLHIREWNWRWMVGIGAVPAVAYLFALLWIPESPRWLAMHGQFDAARRILVRAHGVDIAEAELVELRTALGRDTRPHEARLRDLLAPELRTVLVVGIVVAIFQQITGMSSVLAYATVIFERAGAAGDASFMQTVYVGLVNLVFTVLAILLVDKVGRRPLLLFGMAGMGAFLALTAYGFNGAGGMLNPTLVLTGLLGFVACFASSIGPLMWVLFSEIFPNRVRALAISCVGLVNSAICFAVQLVFPWQMGKFGGANTFLIYGVFALIGLLLMTKVLPETRGRSLEELEESLVRHR